MTVIQAALHVGPICLLLLLLTLLADGQEFGEQCLAKYKQGRVDFILDTDGSVKDGATFLSSPKVVRYKDCVLSCCKDSKCNVAFMERGDADGLIKSCFLFDCLYKTKYVCRFVGKAGYFNYFLNSVYESDLLAVESNPGETTTTNTTSCYWIIQNNNSRLQFIVHFNENIDLDDRL